MQNDQEKPLRVGDTLPVIDQKQQEVLNAIVSMLETMGAGYGIGIGKIVCPVAWREIIQKIPLYYCKGPAYYGSHDMWRYGDFEYEIEFREDATICSFMAAEWWVKMNVKPVNAAPPNAYKVEAILD